MAGTGVRASLPRRLCLGKEQVRGRTLIRSATACSSTKPRLWLPHRIPCHGSGNNSTLYTHESRAVSEHTRLKPSLFDSSVDPFTRRYSMSRDPFSRPADRA